MRNKYNLTKKQNIFLAKRNIVDYIWKSAKLEGFGVTFPETYSIFNGMSAAGVSVSEIVTINNLKHAWQFVLDYTSYPTDLTFICKVHQLVGGNNIVLNAGYLRKCPVSIGGTSWKPPIPDENEIKDNLSSLMSIKNPTDRAISVMLYLMRSQIFEDGNKRTAMLTANQIMIENGCGVISIPVDKLTPFITNLLEFYETDDSGKIKDFIYDNCIDGVEYPKENQMTNEAEL